MAYKWNIISEAYNIPEVLLAIVKQKGITSSEIKEFIKKDSAPHDPFLLTNMDKICFKIKKYIDENKKLVIVGDYDCDGITATAVLFLGLKNLNANVEWILPDRFKDGYGLSKNLIDKAKDMNADVIITVDNGIAAKDAIELAKSMGIDVLVTDHHQPKKEEIPDALIINPQIDDNYPFKGICGCMVAFKLVLALTPNIEIENEELYNELVCLSTIATIADMMPLLDENRYYVKKGLNLIQSTQNIGLKTLISNMNLKKQIMSDDIAFFIAPCINASGRLESPEIALNLLLSDDEVTASKFADKLIKLNNERKRIQKEVLDSLEIDDDEKVIILKLENVGHGILGIIAGQVVEKYQRPCFALGYDPQNKKLSGSGRSVADYNIFSVVERNSHILSGGGHEAACGVKLSEDNLEEFKRLFFDDFMKWMTNNNIEEICPVIDITALLHLNIINKKLIETIDKLQPFGQKNLEPIFASKNLEVESFKIVGQNLNTIQMTLLEGESKIKAVGFNSVKDEYEKLGNPKFIDIVYTLGLNEWPKNVFTPQLKLKDIKISNN